MTAPVFLPVGLFAQVAQATADVSDVIQPWHWLAFTAFVIFMLTFDMLVVHRGARESSMREAGFWTGVMCALAAVFNVILYFWLGTAPASEFLAGYLVEWALSMDNVFVFAVIFGFFRVPMKYQHRVLFWGILGAVIMRLSFIFAGKAIVSRFDWVLPLLGLVLIYTGIKLAFHGDNEVHPDQNILMKLARRMFNVAKEDHGESFFVREAGKFCITPLFLVLLVIESTDVVFAVDSVPAIFGLVDNDADYFTFIVFTSNVFAILGLRALYFLLAGMMGMFRYLGYGLSAILVFVGCKMLIEYAAHKFHWVADGHHIFTPVLSLSIVVSLLAVSITASIIAARREAGQLAQADAPQAPHE